MIIYEKLITCRIFSIKFTNWEFIHVIRSN